LQKKDAETRKKPQKEAAVTQRNHQVLFWFLPHFSYFVVVYWEVLLCNIYLILFHHFDQQGKEVILYNVFRDHTTPVAKATILSTDRKKMVGGRELGLECCEVVINYIIKRDALLPRPIGNITTMGQAQGRSIAWLYKHVGFYFWRKPYHVILLY
jgi:hypothetical protein